MDDSLLMVLEEEPAMSASNAGDDGGRRGITIELSAAVAAELRRRHQRHRQPKNRSRRQPRGLEVLLRPGREDVPAVPDDQDWDCWMAVANGGGGGDDSSNDNPEGGEQEEPEESSSREGRDNESNHTGDDDGGDDDDDDSSATASSSSSSSSSTALSLTPPATRPVVRVDCARLAGYAPSCAADRIALRRTVRAALWGDGEGDAAQPGVDGSSNREDDDEQLILARDFEERVTELFAAGVARHGDTSSETNNRNDDDDDDDDSDDIDNASSSRFIAVEYPEYLCDVRDGDGGAGATVAVRSTARVWKRLQRPHSAPPVERVLARLRECGRSLLWKRRVRRALLRDLVAGEQEAADRRRQSAALQHWKERRRPGQLEQLYAVREALQERVRRAEERQLILEGRRDAAVQRELHRRRLLLQSTTPSSSHGARGGGGGGGLEAFDFDSTVFAFPKDNGDACGGGMLSFLPQDDEDEEYRRFLEQQQYHDGQEGETASLVSDDEDDDDDGGYNGADSSASESDADDEAENGAGAARVDVGAVANPNDGENDAAAVEATPNDDDGAEDAAAATQDASSSHVVAPPSSRAEQPRQQQQRRQRHHRRQTRQRRRQEAAREADHTAKLRAARAEEEAVRESCTAHPLRLAAAAARALRGKLQQVDDLLESLQEEQWADEEEAEEQERERETLSHRQNDTEEKTRAQQQQQVSVLDQVLAMILGACPPPEGTSLEDHVRFLEREHRTILVEWEQYFGRLPPPLPSSTNADAEAAGGGDWDTTKAETTLDVMNALPDATPQDMRRSLGIEENENDNWDSDDEEEVPQEPPRTVGLRPGGRVEPRQ